MSSKALPHGASPCGGELANTRTAVLELIERREPTPRREIPTSNLRNTPLVGSIAPHRDQAEFQKV
jgi:hypothetical protein